jgi:hypothetical protein
MPEPRLTYAVLVVADISGYTSFIKHRNLSLVHAESIITALLESVIDRAEHPLRLNKLEGDAAMLWAEAVGDPSMAIREAVAQTAAMFPAFEATLQGLKAQMSGCTCDACSGLERLALKAFVHAGEIAVKQVRQFEELAGEPVISVHRLMKNHVPVREYVLWTEPVQAEIGDKLPTAQMLQEEQEGLGTAEIWWLPHQEPAFRALAGSLETMPTKRAETVQSLAERKSPRPRANPVAVMWAHAAVMWEKWRR